MSALQPDYTYIADVLSVHDGDTFKADVDLGFGVHMTVVFRMHGINAPELKTGEPGKLATEKLRSMILGKRVLVKTSKDKREKFGRMLAVVCVDGTTGTVNANMVSSGNAVPFMEDR